MKRLFFLIIILLPLQLVAQLETSVAGLFPLSGSGRVVYSFNPGWRFYRGDVKGAEAVHFNDASWDVVTTPHTVQLMPAEASGCRNYQGIAWYRKHFVLPTDMKGKQAFLHFEAIMGKQEIYVNGKKVKTHLGGYLPITVNLTECGVHPGDSCVIAVKADNSDDGTYPPGKKQIVLDFCYHGGIYRDVWLIGKSQVSITDAIEAGKVAGGGVFLHYDNISGKSAKVFINTDIKNGSNKALTVLLIATVRDAGGKVVKVLKSKLSLSAGESKTAVQQTLLKNPHLWSPNDPYLYKVELRIMDGKYSVDGGMVRMGIRKAEFRGKEGFWLNGKPFGQLIGANRHQDFAYVGNALPNSQQWRDAKRLRDAGCVIIRSAHYPQDPAFMDACDELGLFVIVATPGWQYWSKQPEFAERVYQNTRDMIRRDRNHACVLMWEPILNETHYPLDFALKSLQLTKDEYPYPGRPAAAADMNSAGVKENYDVVYGWPGDDLKADAPKQCIFTREFGEYVDDWYAHNNINRASRSWGEHPQLVQALSLADTYGQMFKTSGQFIGGAQWHPFDHQRGYHPDPYWGGIYDAFRQPKSAYYMFRSQSPANIKLPVAESGPMVYIANEMTQFSDSDVVIFSNCDSVRLSAYDGVKVATLPVVHAKGGIPNAPVVFKGFWSFWEARNYSYYQKNWQKVNLVAEGIINGKVVCTTKKMPSRRSTKIRLYVDSEGKSLVADGSDFIVVVAEITDDNGNVRRLAKDNIVFTVEGEGKIIGDASILANPRAVEWGSAPVLIQSTRKAGKIKVNAHPMFEGVYAPTEGSIEFESIPENIPACYVDKESGTYVGTSNSVPSSSTQSHKMSEEEKQKSLHAVEQQQADFGIK
jgi:beta-galactosidase